MKGFIHIINAGPAIENGVVGVRIVYELLLPDGKTALRGRQSHFVDDVTKPINIQLEGLKKLAAQAFAEKEMTESGLAALIGTKIEV